MNNKNIARVKVFTSHTLTCLMFIALCFQIPFSSFAAVRYVPSQYATIQAAINATCYLSGFTMTNGINTYDGSIYGNNRTEEGPRLSRDQG